MRTTTTTTTQILNPQENQGFCGCYIAHEYDHGATTFYNKQPLKTITGGKRIMGNRDSSIRALAGQLGKGYRVTVIDLEPVVYRDFGNGFNVEISGMYTTSKRKKATIYLWHGDKQPDCIIVKTVHDVCREDIGSVVEELHDYSEGLIRAGKDNRESIFNLKFKAWNMAKG